MEAQPEEPLVDRGIAQVDERAAAVSHGVKPVDARSALEDRCEEPETREDGLARRLKRDSRAHGKWLGDSLVDRDFVTGARQEQTDGCAGGSAADYPYVEHRSKTT